MEFPITLSLESLKSCHRYFDKTYQQGNVQCHSIHLAVTSKFKRVSDIAVSLCWGGHCPGTTDNCEVD